MDKDNAPMLSASKQYNSRQGDAFYESESNEIFSLNLEKYYDIFRANKLLISGFLVLALGLGLAATLLATPQYRSTARVEISPVQQNVTNVEGLESEALLTDRSYLPTQ